MLAKRPPFPWSLPGLRQVSSRQQQQILKRLPHPNHRPGRISRSTWLRPCRLGGQRMRWTYSRPCLTTSSGLAQEGLCPSWATAPGSVLERRLANLSMARPLRSKQRSWSGWRSCLLKNWGVRVSRIPGRSWRRSSCRPSSSSCAATRRPITWRSV